MGLFFGRIPQRFYIEDMELVPKRIIIAAGGTGGHIYPALAVCEKMQKEGWDVLWVGSPDRMESKLIPERGIPFSAINFKGVRGKGLLSWLTLPFRLLRARQQARRLIKVFQPSVVIGFGGYITVPICYSANALGVSVVLHEQNAVLGSANKFLQPYATYCLSAYPDIFKRGTPVGNPVREVFFSHPAPYKRYDEREGRLKVLVVGGSLGAQVLNDVVPKAMALLPEDMRPIVTHQSGQAHIDALRENYAKAAVQASCEAYIDDMDVRLANADLVICRAGAMTVSEVTAVGVAALFVPLPTAIDDHQTANVRALVEEGAADKMAQKDLTPEVLADWIQSHSREQLKDMAQRAHTHREPMAAVDIAGACIAAARLLRIWS